MTPALLTTFLDGMEISRMNVVRTCAHPFP